MKNRNFLKWFFTSILIGINYIIIIFSFRSNPLSNILNGHDSSMFMYFGKGMNHGLIPYNDMFDHKGIVLFWIQQFANFIGQGNDSLGIWIVELIFYALTLLFLFKTAYLLSKNPIISSLSILLLTGPELVAFDSGNYSEEFALTFISLALYLFTKLILRNQTNLIDLLLIGITGGLTFFIRSNMIALWIVFCLYLLIKGLIDKNYNNLVKQIIYIFLGGLVVCLSVLLYSILVGNLSEMVYQTWTLNVTYSQASTPLEKWQATKLFFNFMSNSGIWALLTLFILYLLINFNRLNNHIFKEYYICLFIYLLINFITVILSGRYYTHYFITMFPPIVVAVCISINGISTFISKEHIRVLAYLTILLLPSSYAYQAIQQHTFHVITATPNQYYNSLDVEQSAYIKSHTKENDRIYVHCLQANIYLLSNRFSFSRFFVLPSLDYRDYPNLRHEFISDLTQEPPKYIVIRKITFEQPNPTNFKIDKSLINFAKKNYIIVPKFKNSENILLKYKN